MSSRAGKTLVLGASPNSERFSHKCILSLADHGIPLVAAGLREGHAGNVPIFRGTPAFGSIHTVTMYIGARNQDSYYSYVITLKPERVIFNPGSENPVFEDMLRREGIEVIHGCTLMMLENGDF